MTEQQDFWKDFNNHAELRRLLKKYGLLTTPTVFDIRVHAVARCWMKLAVAHLRDAIHDCRRRSRRSFYSRGYYAVYNASKSIRYLAVGYVSAKGDDHQKVSSLPNDFPDVATWGVFLRDMYKYRLVADYDGWPRSTSALRRYMGDALRKCRTFIIVSKRYARTKYGVQL